MQLYSYDGPVMMFDKIIDDNWKASTYASTPQKAKSNLLYRFKKEHNFVPNVKITLPKEVILKEM